MIKEKKKKVVLCVVEGEKTEIQALNAVQTHFMPNNNLDFIAFKTDIYQFYQNLELDSGLEAFFLLKETLLKKSSEDQQKIIAQCQRNDVASIYLFFDYDKHATGADDAKIIELLDYFNDEKENGKLYISYPMVEAFKDPKVPHIVLIENGKKYKKTVNNTGENTHIPRITAEKWECYFSAHLKVAHDLVEGKKTIPSHKTVIDKINQKNIFKQQKIKHIDSSGSVAVLSPFALFVLEYLKPEKADVLLERLEHV